MSEPTTLVVECSEWRLQVGRTVGFLAAPLRSFEGDIYRQWELQVWTDRGQPNWNRNGAITFHESLSADDIMAMAKVMISRIENERCGGLLSNDRVQHILDTTVIRAGRVEASPSRRDVISWAMEKLGHKTS